VVFCFSQYAVAARRQASPAVPPKYGRTASVSVKFDKLKLIVSDIIKISYPMRVEVGIKVKQKIVP